MTDLPSEYSYQKSIIVIQDWEKGLLTHDQAFDQLTALEATAQAAGETLYVAQIINNTGIIHYRMSNFEAALTVFKRAQDLFLSVEAYDRAAGALMNIGTISESLGKQEMARQAFREAFNVASHASAYFIQALALVNEAYIFIRSNRYEHALVLAQQGRTAMLKHLESNDPSKQYPIIAFSQIYQLIAQSEGQLGQVNAWDSLREAIALAKQSESTIALAQTHVIAIELVYQLGNPPEDFRAITEAHYHQALTMLREAEAFTELSRTHMTYGRRLITLGRVPEALEQIQSAIELFHAAKMTSEWFDARALYLKYAGRPAAQHHESET